MALGSKSGLRGRSFLATRSHVHTSLARSAPLSYCLVAAPYALVGVGGAVLLAPSPSRLRPALVPPCTRLGAPHTC